MRFRHKLLAAFLSLLAVVLSASLWVIQKSETRRAESEAMLSFSSAREILKQTLDARRRELATSLRLLSGDFAFKQAVATGDAETARSASANHRRRIGADLLLIVDAEGGLLADTRRRAKLGRKLGGNRAVREALDEGAAAFLGVFDGSPTLLAAAPILAPDLLGAVVGGFLIDEALAQSLRRQTGTHVSFAAGATAPVSTLPAPARAALESRLGTLPEGRAEILELGGERWLSLSLPLGEGLQLILCRSWDAALEPLKALRDSLLVTGIAGLAIAMLLGILIAGGITRALAELSEATHLLAQGRYDIALAPRSKDEFGELAEAFTRMAKGMLERDRIRSVLSKAVSKEIAESLLSQGKIELGGEERAVTVLFSDIRGFTTISESLAPKELVTQLNDYFGEMTRAIEKQHGVIDKYIGDAIMALFGAPVATPRDPANALRAALSMQAALSRINERRRAAGLSAWTIGVGVNTGPVVAGTLGSEERWSYTVIGDAVNLASRLEGLTKHYAAGIVVSEATRQAAGPGFAFRTLDRVIVKGKNEPVQIYELLAEGPAPAWLAEYERGLEDYRARRYQDAGRRLKLVLESSPQDGPARMYLERAESMSRGGGDSCGPTRMEVK